ncbi:amidohydrolase family protein [Steroidobacter sp.]|uniref:amidohydrolase family protein n=1 Tax=Steroidobacter sp. TaxID=1978227 RepID=UPI001A5ADBF0|nr:amidohydrolase family protein [Steroidobacter sp.]MBL8271019.1 PD40 domain-containing protein [Steroidobacter sp.]
MSLDVAPDSRTLVFDLLGDLYSLPIDGGKAKRLTHGSAFDAQPRYSPNGRSIVFVSDRSGADNLWILDVDTGEQRPLTQDTGVFYVSPEWTPDGESILATRSTRDTGHGRDYQLYSYAVRSGVSQPMGVSDTVLGAAFGNDSQQVFGAIEVKPQWPSFATWQIASIERATGRVEQVTRELNNAVRPVVSPDGRYLVYANSWAGATHLKLLDLVTREQRWLVSNVDRPSGEVAPRRDLLPGAAFSADGNALFTAYRGQIWRIGVADGSVSRVPFSADVEVELAPLAQFDHAIEERTVTARRIEQPQLSPDGRQLAFSALGRIWIQAMDSRSGTRAPRQVSAEGSTAFFPAWSPDGRHLAYVTWNDLDGGGIWRVPANGTAPPERLTVDNDFYEKLSYSPDGQRLVAARARWAERFGFFNETQGIGRGDTREWVWLPTAGGSASVVTHINAVTYWGANSHYGRAHFVAGDEGFYFKDPKDGLVAVRWDGAQRRSILRIEAAGFSKRELADEILLSPDGAQALALVNNQTWLVDLPKDQTTLPLVDLSATTPALPARRLSKEGAEFPQWSNDGRCAAWSLGTALFTQCDKNARRHDVMLRVPRDVPKGVIALRGARVITMRGDEIIERADVIVSDDKILAVGAAGSIKIPADAHVIDVTGKTILPGYVDVHWHGAPPWGVHRTQVWEFLVNLAYGVTAVRDPQPASMDALTYADRIASGAVLGPRFFTTGRGVFGTDDIRTSEDARAIARRYAQFYRTESLKDYVTNGDRQVHRWLLDAAREYRLTTTAEANSDFKYSLTRLFDGSGGQEHLATVTPYYQDLVRLAAASGTTITPTLLEGQSGGQDRLNAFVNQVDLYSDEKVLRFLPAEEIESLTVGARTARRRASFTSQELVAQPAAVLAAGGRIALGVHGSIQGLGAHWTLWTFVDGGMKAHDALRAATLMGAQAIGYGKEFGSIEVGKRADLQVLDANPLEDIRHTLSLRYVMINGRLYETDTLNQLWPRQKSLGLQWWQRQSRIPKTHE